MRAAAPLVLLLAACSTASPARPATPSASATARPSVSATAAAPAPSPVQATDALTACGAARTEAQVGVLARLVGDVDDVAAAPDGTVWVSVNAGGRLLHLSRAGRVLDTVVDTGGPEGMLVTAAGALIVAEQTRNRVAVTGEPWTSFRTLLQLTNTTGQLGVDGLGIDTAEGRLLVPDSPNGALLAIPQDGGPVSTLATGLGRPVAAAVGVDGALYVAAESGAGLLRIPRAGGRPATVGGEHDLDEVVAGGSILYVTNLGAGTLRAVDPSTGAARTLVTGDASPQGLARLPDGTLILTDSTRGLVLSVPPCRGGG